MLEVPSTHRLASTQAKHSSFRNCNKAFVMRGRKAKSWEEP